MKSSEMTGSWLPKYCSEEGGGGCSCQLTVRTKRRTEKNWGGQGDLSRNFSAGQRPPGR